MQALFKLSHKFFIQYIYATDSGYKNKNISFYPKSLRPFLRILCVVDDYASLGSARMPSAPSLRFASNHLYSRFDIIYHTIISRRLYERVKRFIISRLKSHKIKIIRPILFF